MSQDLLGNQQYRNYLVPKQEKDKGFNWTGVAGAATGAAASYFSGGTIDPLAAVSTGYNIGSTL
jgi:hypothetical protein